MLESIQAPWGGQAPGRMCAMTIPLPLPDTALFLASAMDIIEWVAGLPVEIYRGYSWLIRQGAESVQSLFEEYGYWVLFLGTMAENTLLVGLIVPGLLVVILAGLAAHDGSISLPLAAVLGILGTVIGDTISYCLGRFGWSRFGESKSLRELNAKVREPILRRGTLFVLIYHFAGYTRVIGPTAAGLLKMPYRRWAPADYGGACIWILAYLGVGYGLGLLGLTLDSTDEYFKYLEWGLLVLAIVWISIILRAHGSALMDRVGQLAERDEPQDSRTAATTPERD
jgi:membrane protein DedA with SNARE-associated domain